jgi:hypothetical protein
MLWGSCVLLKLVETGKMGWVGERLQTRTKYYLEYIVQCWGSSISSDHQLYRVTPLKTPFGLLIPLLQSSPTRNYIHSNYFLRYYTCTQLTITYTFVTKITYFTLARLHNLCALHSNLYCTIAHKVS